MKYSIVIPIFNAEKNLPRLYDRLKRVMDSATEEYEIIFIDDASMDKSWGLLEDLHRKDKKCKILQLLRNYGQQNAVLCGFQYATGDYIITMDDDLQHMPEDIPKLIKAIDLTGEDVIIGSFQKKEHGFFENLGSKYLNSINSRVFNKPVDLQMTAFRIIRKEIKEHVLEVNSVNPAIGPLLLSTTSRIKNVEVTHKKRESGHSGYSFFKHISLALDSIANHSVFPLKVISILGLFASTVGFGLAIFFLIQKLFLESILPGWTSLIVLNLTLFGIVLFSMGIIGEYLLRIIKLLKNYPTYIIRKKKL